MRMPEFWDLLRHPEWYDVKRRCIEVPKRVIQKKKLKIKYRQVNLTLAGCDAVEHLFKVNPKQISRQAMTETLCFAARKAQLPELDKGIAPKMFRKTIVSWLMKTYPDKMFEIAASAGHTLEVMREHYKEDMVRFLKGWGEA
jgi:integrase